MQSKSFIYGQTMSTHNKTFINVDDAITANTPGQWTAIIAPPMTLTAQALSQYGINADSALIIHKAKVSNKFHTLLKAAQSPTIAAVVTWDDALTASEIFKITATMKAYNKKCVIQSSKKLH